MFPLQFVKMHGLGNDFIVADCITHPAKIDLLIHHTAFLCDRHFGIGADGLILVLPSLEGDFRMRIINSDGSEPEMCGNGIRCFARYVYQHGLTRKKAIVVETLAGAIKPELILNGDVVASVRVDMGEPRLERSTIPMLGPTGQVVNEALQVEGRTFNVTAVSMGNPHTVIFVEDVAHFPVEKFGPIIEKHPSFPKHTNVEFVQRMSSSYLRMRVWERGAGITLACGTGACASLVAGVLSGNTGRRATVELPGGALDITWSDENNHIYMTGPAEEVFTGTVQLPTIDPVSS